LKSWRSDCHSFRLKNGLDRRIAVIIQHVAQAASQLIAGTVVAVRDDGDTLCVAVGETTANCDILSTGAAPPRYAAGDRVLFWQSGAGERGVVLGIIGRPSAAPAVAEVPAEVLLEATDNLTLKCGDGSITIRADGKILIKGNNLVSLAMETNRIKGGSVAIN
jgi:hypothetical protein